MLFLSKAATHDKRIAKWRQCASLIKECQSRIRCAYFIAAFLLEWCQQRYPVAVPLTSFLGGSPGGKTNDFLKYSQYKTFSNETLRYD